MSKKESRLKAKLQLAWAEIESLKALLEKKQKPEVPKPEVSKPAKKTVIRRTKKTK